MSEHPILMNSAMVRALLAGAKTQTRRPIMPQPEFMARAAWPWRWKRGKYSYVSVALPPDQEQAAGPYSVGDLLWVREAAYIAPVDFCDASSCNCRDNFDNPRVVSYAAGIDPDEERCAKDYLIEKTPSIHMPRWASRITLEITALRVQRVNEITRDDAIAEGVAHDWQHVTDDFAGTGLQCDMKLDPLAEFAIAWDALYVKRGLGFNSGCWVWVVEFRRIEP